MSILIDKHTRLLVQGITGREGAYHTKQMLEYGTNIVAGLTPGRGGEKVALKILHERAAQDPDLVARFNREADIAKKIASPYVAGILGSGKERVLGEGVRLTSGNVAINLCGRTQLTDVIDLAAQCRATSLQCHRVGAVPERCRPFAKVFVGIHDAADLSRKAKADKDAHRLFEHVGFHDSLLPNPECRRAPSRRRPFSPQF